MGACPKVFYRQNQEVGGTMKHKLIHEYDDKRFRHVVLVIDENSNGSVLGHAEYILGRWKVSGGWPDEYRDLKDAINKILLINQRVCDEIKQESDKLLE